jgi:hypothetical protein
MALRQRFTVQWLPDFDRHVLMPTRNAECLTLNR